MIEKAAASAVVDEEGPTFRSVLETAAAGAGAGLLFSVALVHAPITLAILGASGGIYAAQRDDGIGDVARGAGAGVGKAACITGKALNASYEHAKKIDGKYGILDKTSVAANVAADKIKKGYNFVERKLLTEDDGDQGASPQKPRSIPVNTTTTTVSMGAARYDTATTGDPLVEEFGLDTSDL